MKLHPTDAFAKVKTGKRSNLSGERSIKAWIPHRRD